MRGCFRPPSRKEPTRSVFPAYAGMFPSSGLGTGMHCRFPRVCGDVSYPVRQNFRYQTFSPRMRGCFPYPAACTAHHKVFPAYAGMFLSGHSLLRQLKGFPRVCGDVSVTMPGSADALGFSPRMRGCFRLPRVIFWQLVVFPAYAGMFLSQRNE